MRTGQHKDKFYAACFVLQPTPVKDDKGNVEMDGTEAKTEMKPKKQEVCYWAESEAEAKAGLQAHMEAKGFEIDQDRTSGDKQMDVEKSVQRMSNARAEKEAAKKAAEEKAKSKSGEETK